MKNAISRGTNHKPKKSVIIFTCQVCRLPQEVQGISSTRICSYCRPIKSCAHGVKVTEECETCMGVHNGNRFMRVM